jgi:histone-lysine N-methyltransferase SETDB1
MKFKLNTGIFECNPKCKCDCRCTNRVVQNGIIIRLQLFKTANKGWGLRCLDDIPKGTFICTYAGHILTDELSDTRGQELGDEYFAELDFVECLRNLRLANLNGDNASEDTNDDDRNRHDDDSDYEDLPPEAAKKPPQRGRKAKKKTSKSNSSFTGCLKLQLELKKSRFLK